MAKREFVVRIVIDDSLPLRQSSRTLIPRDGRNEFILKMNPNDDRQPLIEVTAHELGHVLGRIFDTPAYWGDPRTYADPWTVLRMREDRPTFAQKQGMLRNETEAWDLAEKMIQVNPATRKRALKSYENA